MSDVIRITRLASALTLLSACLEPPGLDDGGTTGTLTLPGSRALASAPLAGKTYVSMEPGTDPEGRSVALRDIQSGDTVATSMLDGGFDPVGLQGSPGDTLSIVVTRRQGTSYTGYSVVPVVSRPKLLRTSPRRASINAPHDGSILVVFTEPMDSSSVSLGVHLQQQGADVPGVVSVESPAGVALRARFNATAPLEPHTAYDLLISVSVRSAGGSHMPLITVPFTTGWGRRDLESFALYPLEVQLATVAPAQSARMRVLALDDQGRELPTDNLVSYASSNRTVAEVAADGMVTARASGTSVIRSTLTLDGESFTDSVVATVSAPDPTATADLDLSGVYDLNSSITEFDPSWGYSSTGVMRTAELTITQQAGTGELVGTYAHELWFSPDGEAPYEGPPGSLHGSVDAEGRVTLELIGEGGQAHLYASGIVMSKQLILGKFASGLSGGIFRAVRRSQR